MIEVKNVSKKYGNYVAVDNISFEVNDNEIVGFLGPNGAGKTTTMNMITGYIEPTSGRIIVDGFDVMKSPRKAKRQIGYMPENVPMYKDLTVKEFINYMAELKGLKGKDKKDEIERVIDETGLTNVKSKLIKFISKGYRQRVGLASCLIGNPDVLILDEPTVGLDPKQIKEIRGLIKSLGKRHTVILSSHILSEVSQICEKVIIINGGKILAIDTTENLEEKFKKTNSIFVVIKDPDEKMQTIKSKLSKEITKVKLIKDNKDGTKEYEVFGKDEALIRSQIFEVFPKENIEIVELKKKEVSLEEAFLNVVNEKDSIKEKEEKSKQKQAKERKQEIKALPLKERLKEKSKDRKEARLQRKEAFNEQYEENRRLERKEKQELKEEKEKRKQAKKVRIAQEKELKEERKREKKEEKKNKGDVLKVSVTGKTRVKKSKETKEKNKKEKQEREAKQKTAKGEKNKGGKK